MTILYNMTWLYDMIWLHSMIWIYSNDYFFNKFFLFLKISGQWMRGGGGGGAKPLHNLSLQKITLDKSSQRLLKSWHQSFLVLTNFACFLNFGHIFCSELCLARLDMYWLYQFNPFQWEKPIFSYYITSGTLSKSNLFSCTQN